MSAVDHSKRRTTWSTPLLSQMTKKQEEIIQMVAALKIKSNNDHGTRYGSAYNVRGSIQKFIEDLSRWERAHGLRTESEKKILVECEKIVLFTQEAFIAKIKEKDNDPSYCDFVDELAPQINAAKALLKTLPQ